MKYKQQRDLFGLQKDWEKDWVGMPEFIQEDLTSFRKLIVHFKSQKEVDTFAKLINQRICKKQSSIWFPKLKIRFRLSKEYVDES